MIFNIILPDNEAKTTFCLTHQIGLWDVIGSCERENSSDTNLQGIVPNDFETLLRNYPNIKVLAFTGKKAFDLFGKYFKYMEVETVLLPSTSAAHASITRNEKAELYKTFLQKYLTV
jgi:hypoxanthine-DNA glycosylase